jgi:hypothetical protein
MPTGDNSQKGVKTVQTMFAAKKTGNTSKENPLYFQFPVRMIF